MPSIRQLANSHQTTWTGSYQITENIGKSVHLKIIQGGLLVGGNIGNNSKISFTIDPQKEQSEDYQAPVYQFVVDGNIGEDVTIEAVNVHITINGSVGANTSINSQYGNILIHGRIQNNVRIKSLSGNITCNQVGKDCEISSISGNTCFQTAGDAPNIRTSNGSIQISHPAQSKQTQIKKPEQESKHRGSFHLHLDDPSIEAVLSGMPGKASSFSLFQPSQIPIITSEPEVYHRQKR